MILAPRMTEARRYTATRTWVERTEHGEQRVTVRLTRSATSQGQVDAEADAILRREVGFDPPPDAGRAALRETEEES